MPLESRLQPVPGLNYRLKPRLQLFNIILTPTNFGLEFTTQTAEFQFGNSSVSAGHLLDMLPVSE